MMISDNVIAQNITQFLSKEAIDALDNLLSQQNTGDNLFLSANSIADVFGAAGTFKDLACEPSAARDEKQAKLVSSFQNNVNLLVKKTWVEKSDETLKEQVQFRLQKLCSDCAEKKYSECYADFLSLLHDVVYLMFGVQTRKQEFLAYALRIDPDFGIFWWYISSLPEKVCGDEEKMRLLELLGMYFLANY